MKWITHEAVAVGLACLAGVPPVGLAGVLLGSVLPDMLDMGLARLLIFRQTAFNRIHRGATHWFGWWLPPLVVALLQYKGFSQIPADVLFVLGVLFGCLIHVLLDMCTTMGVPVAPWTRKHMISLKLCSTGGLREYLFLAAFVVLFGFLAHDDLMKLVAEAKRHMPKL